jgi:hypothetical protein
MLAIDNDLGRTSEMTTAQLFTIGLLAIAVVMIARTLDDPPEPEPVVVLVPGDVAPPDPSRLLPVRTLAGRSAP